LLKKSGPIFKSPVATLRPTSSYRMLLGLTLGTHYNPTSDPAVLWTPSNDTSRPIFSDRLNLTPPAPLYLRTLWRYTNAAAVVIIIIIIIIKKET